MSIPPELIVDTWFYETYIPRRFTLDNGEVVELTAKEIEEKISREPLFLLYIPPKHIDDVYRLLKAEKFSEMWLRVPKGEKYSLVKKLVEPWELHVRIHEGGLIESEVEVSRDYVEHLGEYRVYVVYELFNFYNKVYNKLHILYKPKSRWIVKVWDNLRVRVSPPKLLTPWKPIVMGICIATAIGLLTYALTKLEKGS